MATINAIANKSGTLTVDSVLTVSAGGAAITGASTINGGTVGIGTTATDSQIDIGTGANAGRTVNVGSATNASVTLIDCGTGGISVGINTAHTSTFGSANGASASTLQSGSGALNVTSANGAMTLNSGNGTISMSTDGANTTMNIGTGAGAKLVTLGSTNGASSLGLRFGTADFSLASATGNIMLAQDTGEVTKPLQSAFSAYLPSADNNVTGNGTQYILGSVTALTEVFDQNGDFNVNGTFTAPTTGQYFFSCLIQIIGCTIAIQTDTTIITTDRNYGCGSARVAGASNFYTPVNFLCHMDAGDTAYVALTTYGEAAATADVYGYAGVASGFSGCLVC